jgi:hypothetical protein
MAPLLPPTLLAVECEEPGSELSGNKRWPMLMPVKSSESPSSAMSESEGALEDDTVEKSSLQSPTLAAIRGVLLLLMMACRHVSASVSLWQRSSSSRSTVRTLMQYGYPV